MEHCEWVGGMQRPATSKPKIHPKVNEFRVFDSISDDNSKTPLTGDWDENPSCYLLCSKERFSMSCPLTEINCSDFVTTSQPFDPFATIQDDDDIAIDIEKHYKTATDEAIFDPWQTIHDDDDVFITCPDVANSHIPVSEDTSKWSLFEDNYILNANETNSVDERNSSNNSTTSSKDENSIYEPLEPFHSALTKNKWNLWVRLPIARKGKLLLSQSRYWKPVLVKLLNLGSSFVIRLYNDFAERDLLHELLLLPTNAVYSEGLQLVDHSSIGPKFHIITLCDVTYDERLSVHSNNRTFPKFRDITSINSFQQFRNLIQKMPKVSMIVRHVSDHRELIKFGSRDPDDIKQFQRVVEDALFHQEFQRQVPHIYSQEELLIEIIDEYYAKLNYQGGVNMHKARVRIFCVAFLSGMPVVEIGLNDERRNGKEIVRRQDIVPLEVEDWIGMEDVELNNCVSQKDFDKKMVIKFQPPDACRYELMRYRIRPIVDRELPLRACGQTSIINQHVHIHCELSVPAYFLVGERICQTPCREIEVQIPIPDSWVYLFHVEKLFRSGLGVTQVKKIPGAFKGLERLALFSQGILQPSMINVSTGTAQYEDLFKAIIWKISALPEVEEDVYRPHTFALHLNLGPQDSISDYRNRTAFITFQMSNHSISRTQVRSVAIEHLDVQKATVNKKIEKLTHYEYRVEFAFFSDVVMHHSAQGFKKNLSENDDVSSDDNHSVLFNDSDIEECDNSLSSY